MKNTTLLLMTVVTLGALSTSVTAFAADESDKATTTGKVNFTQGGTDPEGGVVPPIHPEEKPSKPIKPGEPGEPGGNGVGGPLSLDFAPGFNFETHDISTQDEEYSAKLITDTLSGNEIANFAQISDRRGNPEGWVLSMTQKDQFKTADGMELNGAELHLKNATYFSMMPEATGAEVTKENDLKVTPASEVTLMTATEGKGMGSHTIRFGSMEDGSAATSVTLKVPGNAIQYADKEYTTTLDWNLASTPGNTEEGQQ